jgi:hypothetical protein
MIAALTCIEAGDEDETVCLIPQLTTDLLFRF